MFIGKISAAYIPTGRGKKNLIVDGFSFTENVPTYWRCSLRRRLGCTASARTNKKGEVIHYDNTHNHEKPKFYNKTTKRMVAI